MDWCGDNTAEVDVGEGERGAAALRQQIADLLLSSLFRRYACSLVRGSGQDAEDLLQNTAQRALACIDQFERGTNLPAWLWVIMRSIYLNEVRHVGRVRRRQAAAGLADGAGVQQPNQVHAVNLSQVLACMDGLSEDHRRALHMYCVEELTCAEAAARVGISRATFKTRLFRARMMLHRLYGEGALLAD